MVMKKFYSNLHPNNYSLRECKIVLYGKIYIHVNVSWIGFCVPGTANPQS